MNPRPASTLQALLSRPDTIQVRRLGNDDARELAQPETATRFTLVRIDLQDCHDKATFLARCATALKLPDWFGHNWDALADSLGDLGDWPAGHYLLLFAHTSHFARRQPDDFRIALDILEDAARFQADGPTPLHILVDAPPPQPPTATSPCTTP